MVQLDMEKFKTALEARSSNLQRRITQTPPPCGVCGKPMRLLNAAEQRWHCDTDDLTWVWKERKWVFAAPQTEQQQTVKYCKKCGNVLELEDEFCDKCGSVQKNILATASTDGQHKMSHSKPTALWYLVPVLFGAIGGVVGHVGVKEDDKEMANNLLWVGIAITVVLIILALLFIV